MNEQENRIANAALKVGAYVSEDELLAEIASSTGDGIDVVKSVMQSLNDRGVLQRHAGPIRLVSAGQEATGEVAKISFRRGQSWPKD